ncbi:MAG: BlaI/MecI/CopY family transcriptional regulator [Capnocytophaga sp.]|nr:BlaI/MecI/CopY family transcriptional regulator [Capnocytophaga sp.]
MIALTAKEEEIMTHFWEDGTLFVKQLIEKYPDPKPHFNTLSTYVRSLEEKGFLSHENLGVTYRYFPVISRTEYQQRTIDNVVKKYFDNSYLSVVNSFVKSENLSVDEIRKLLDEIEQNQ